MYTEAELLRELITNLLSRGEDYQRMIRRIDAALIREALRMADGNQSEVARLLKMPRSTLNRRVQRYGLERYAQLSDRDPTVSDVSDAC